MNEISVKVRQTPGEASWNFEEIKKSLEADLEIYRKLVYTDDTIKSAKEDIAELRKLAKTIEDRRKEVKAKCLEPYNRIEEQAKELVSLIEKPIEAINNQVQDYEKRRKEKVRAEIMAYWQQKAVELPEDIREKAKTAIYDSRWENATATKKSWREGIDAGVSRITEEIATIQSFHSEFEEDAMRIYKSEFSLQRAIQKMNGLKAQKERILEMERQKKEREEREEREREAREQEKLNQKEAEKSVASTPQNMTSAGNLGRKVAPVKENRESESKPIYVSHCGSPYQPINGEIRTIRIYGSSQQIKKILDYIKFTGAKYEEV